MPMRGDRAVDALSEETFLAFAQIAHDVAGLHLPGSKRAMVAARVSKRLSRLALTSFEEYLALVARRDSAERQRFIASLTTHVSKFFREPHHFAFLRETVLPSLMRRAQAGERIRLWSAGCAHGQEAYSIALTLLEAGVDPHALDIKVLGTDIDPAVIRTAQLGAYHETIMRQVPPALRAAHFSFDPSSGAFLASKGLRDMVIFRELNLHDPWPMPGRFDVIFCRNVMIYFDAARQNALWRRFEGKLCPGGWLFVGHSERVSAQAAPALLPHAHTIYALASAGPA
ncbi:MAG: protein-glutamate O-methyltransferase [Pseudomonadota bacterium]